MTYKAPTNILEVLQKIEYEEALPAGDPRYVDTTTARGSEKTFSRLARKFGWDPTSKAFFAPNEKHVLFFGHIGSGKTTELRRYARWLNDSKRFYVVEVDVLAKLDRNNLQYTEALMAMAESLLERMANDGYNLDEGDLQPVRDWFAKAVNTKSNTHELSAELKTGLQAGGGIPGLVKLFAGFTAAFKTGSSQKNEWRQEIRNRFTTLADAFNQLIRSAEAQLKQQGRAERNRDQHQSQGRAPAQGAQAGNTQDGLKWHGHAPGAALRAISAMVTQRSKFLARRASWLTKTSVLPVALVSRSNRSRNAS